MKTYKQIFDKIHEVDFALCELRVDLETLEQDLGANGYDTSKIKEAHLLVRHGTFIEDIKAKVLLAEFETKYKHEHGYQVNEEILK